jgi:hypothetical protein
MDVSLARAERACAGTRRPARAPSMQRICGLYAADKCAGIQLKTAAALRLCRIELPSRSRSRARVDHLEVLAQERPVLQDEGAVHSGGPPAHGVRTQQRHTEGAPGERPAWQADEIRERAGRARPRAGALPRPCVVSLVRCQSRAGDACSC